jgi:uncharacterized membrane protein YkvA (DUF1232 family)
MATESTGDEQMDARTSGRVRQALRTITPDFVRRGARSVTRADLDRVVEKAEAVETRFGGGGPLGRFVEDGRLALALVRDYAAGRYRTIPFGSLAAIVFALLYLLNPLDLIPDVIPIIGHLDDAAVLSVTLVLIEQDLHAYRTWREAAADGS